MGLGVFGSQTFTLGVEQYQEVHSALAVADCGQVGGGAKEVVEGVGILFPLGDVEHLAQGIKHLSVLINNAGLGGQKTVVQMSDEEWQRVLDVTLTGTFRMTRAMLPHMQQRGAGAIVNNASVLGWRAQKEQAHYAAAKAGVMALTRCSALEAAEFGVRINAVSPSIALHDFLKKASSEELLASLAGREAFGHAAEVWEVANVMMFLASDYASYMVGEVLSVSSQQA